MDEKVYTFHICKIDDYTYRYWKDNGDDLMDEEGYRLPKTFEEQFEYALARDDAEEFVELINRLPSKTDMPEFISGNMFLEMDSVNCLAAVLEGKTSPNLVANDGSSFWGPKGEISLYAAALYAAPRVTQFLLDQGDDPDARCSDLESNMKGKLPLDLAFRNLWLEDRISTWTPELSAFALIARLSEATVRHQLETVRLLVRKMKGIEKEIVYYVNEGKVVELAVLLLVARKKVMASVESAVNAISTIHQFESTKEILREQCKERRLALIGHLLDVFKKVGDQLAAYIQLDRPKNIASERMVAEISWILGQAGYDVKYTLLDDLYRWSTKCLNIVRSIVRLDEPMEVQRRRIPYNFNSINLYDCAWSGLENKQAFSISTFGTHGSTLRSFHTLCASDAHGCMVPTGQMRKTFAGVPKLHLSRFLSIIGRVVKQI